MWWWPRDALWRGLAVLGVPPKLVELVSSFHSGMTARVRVGDTHTKEIAVNNGLRQGCTMSPVLFNLFFALVFERWQCEMAEQCPGSELQFRYNINGNLFNRLRIRHDVGAFASAEFADDAALVVPSHHVAQQAITIFNTVATQFGLIVNFAKTKFMACGVGVTAADQKPLCVAGQRVEHVESFTYLGCLITPNARVGQEIDHRLAAASRAFGALQCVFQDRNLSVRTKRMIYTACVLTVLMYGSECWPVLRRDEKRLDCFHHQCLRSILRVSRWDQEQQHITNQDLRKRWGDESLFSDMLRRRRLQWLGHVARMSDERIPKQLLFGWLPRTRPAHGPCLRWRDRVQSDLKLLGVNSWYQLAQHRVDWRALYSTSVRPASPALSVLCDECGRTFRSQSAMARHKCLAERALPIPEQPGSRQCQSCCRWFRSAGGYAVHRCMPQAMLTGLPSQPQCVLSSHRQNARVPVPGKACCDQHCGHCDRCFSRQLVSDGIIVTGESAQTPQTESTSQPCM